MNSHYYPYSFTIRRFRIMSILSDFLAAQKAYNDQLNAYIDSVLADVKHLNDVITQLQNSPGAVTPEDQAAIDGLQAQGKDLINKMNALDSMTPPAPPPAS